MEDDRPGPTDLADAAASAGLAWAGVSIVTGLRSTGALVVALAFLVAGLADVLAGALAAEEDAAASSVLAEVALADLLTEADVFVTGSSLPKCVIHRQMS